MNDIRTPPATDKYRDNYDCKKVKEDEGADS
jgi:hypothetical protein